MNYLCVIHFVSLQYLAPCSLDKGVIVDAYDVVEYSYRQVRILSSWIWIALCVPKISVNSHQILETAHCATVVLLKCWMSKWKTTKFYHIIQDFKCDIKLGTILQVVRCFCSYIGSWELGVCVWAILLNQLMLLEYLRKVRIAESPDMFYQFM